MQAFPKFAALNLNMKLYLIACLLICCKLSAAFGISLCSKDTSTGNVQVYQNFAYARPKPFFWAKRIPIDVYEYSKGLFKKKNIAPAAAVIASTALLIIYDQPIIDAAQHLGDQLGIKHTNALQTFWSPSIKIGNKVQGLPFNGPKDLNTAMYFLGDGITHFSIAASFWLTGLINKDNRALQTGSQLTEAILSTGLVTQTLKHLTGRQSPYTSTCDAGRWDFFPNQQVYNNHVPEYDAFPSGHLATAMATVTVISSNYPEYKFIKPVGYSLMGVLAFAMLNNGVHWASDYPLSLALGYGLGKIAVLHGRKPASTGHIGAYPFKWNILPTASSRSAGLQLVFQF